MTAPARKAALLAALAGALAAAPLRAQVDCTTPGEAWTIRSFDAAYAVREDGGVDVTERLDVDFGSARKHGIYRDVRTRFYRPVAGFRERVEGVPGSGALEQASFDLDVHDVTDETGEPYGLDVADQGDLVRIRIGSPDFCVSGRRTYVIRYTIDDAVVDVPAANGRPAYQELYWQVTGTEWPVAIDRADATVSLPSARAAARVDSLPWGAFCYAGGPQSTSSERCGATVDPPGPYRFRAANLAPGEGLTLAAGFPAGVVPGPTPLQRAWTLFLLLGPLAIPPIALGIMLTVWLKRGRDRRAGSVAPRWDPPEDLRPGAAGALIDQKADMDDVIATVLDLAVRGYLRIREVPPTVLPGVEDDSFLGKALGAIGVRKDDWELERLKPGEEGALLGFETRLLQGLFDGGTTVRMGDLKNEFYKDVPEVQTKLYDDLVERKLFPRSPQSTRRMWIGIGVAVILVGVALGFAGFAIGSPLVLPAMVIAGLVVLGFAFVMPATTPLGAKARLHVEGLEEYIRRAEKAEMEFAQAPEKTPALFDRLLPYAVALNVTDLWVRQFDGILTRPPDWYQGRTGAWNPALFASDLSGFRSSAATTLASSPSSSGGGGGSFGGGSVGGGGGGGGGGSW